MCAERVEGRSLLGVLRGEAGPDRRDCAICEIDFSDRGPRALLDVPPWEYRAHMLRTDRWKYVLHERCRPRLFDPDDDPRELVDLGDEPGYEGSIMTSFPRKRESIA